jgi:hypothetical protein
MRHATCFGNPLAEQGVVSAVIIANERVLPIAEEGSSVLTATTIGEVVHDGLQVIEEAWSIVTKSLMKLKPLILSIAPEPRF